MFEVENGTVKINGAKGRYDSKNSSANYGKNAVDNYYSYIEQPIKSDNFATPPILDFGVNPDNQDKNLESMAEYVNENDKYLNSLPPLEFEYRYMPEVQKGTIDKQALLSAAYQDMSANEITVEDMERNFLPDRTYTAKPLDINNDGKIDTAEYSSSILAADMLSKSDTPDFNNIDGTVNNKGFNALMEYTKKSNAKAAAELYSKIYTNFNLSEAQKEFKAE